MRLLFSLLLFLALLVPARADTAEASAQLAAIVEQLALIDKAIDDVSTLRGNIGANQNRLSYAAANLSTTVENITAAESVIRDVDMAAEMTSFTKSQILVQAGTAMVAQANTVPQSALRLLQ